MYVFSYILDRHPEFIILFIETWVVGPNSLSYIGRGTSVERLT